MESNFGSTPKDETEKRQWESASALLQKKECATIVRNGTSVQNDNDGDQRYGWSRNCSPDSIQWIRNKKVFLVIFCLTCVVQGMFSTYFVAVITTLEKLFSIHSRTIGTLLAATELGQVTSSLFLPYFVGNGHRPRWIGIGAALFSLAALMCASPHVLLPVPAHFNQFSNRNLIGLDESNAANIGFEDGNGNESIINMVPKTKDYLHNSTYYCSIESTNSTNGICHDFMSNGEESNSKYLILSIFFLSLLTIGLGQTAVYTLGIPYLDDNVTNKDSPLYFSITIGVKILGPVLGFILGSLCTRLYIYPNIDPGFDTNHIHWLGAWWLGMVLISILLFIVSILMFGFPMKLSVSKQNGILEKMVDNQQPSISSNTVNQNQPIAKKSLRNFPVRYGSAIKRLLLNRMLVLRTFSSVFHLLPISGLYTFLPKYLENQFRLPAHQANMITALAGILVMGVGIFASGIYIRKYGPNAKAIARWIAICALIYSCGMFLLTTIGCDDNEFFDSSFGKPKCGTSECACSNSTYSPVCGSDGKTYFSPCFAGCPTQFRPDNATFGTGAKKLQNCSCIEDGVSIATEEFCKPSCVSNINIYLIIFVAIVLVHSTSEVGSMLLTLRCVEPRDKSMALGLIQASIGIFGNVPCPIVYGAIVDYTCILWGKITAACAGEDAVGYCLIYDTKLFRRLFHGATGSLMLIAFLIDIVVYIKADSINLHETIQPEAEIPNREGKLSNASIKSQENIPMLNISLPPKE